jgi:hypothetical protein
MYKIHKKNKEYTILIMCWIWITVLQIWPLDIKTWCRIQDITYTKHIGMTNTKIVIVSQANNIYQYKNTKSEVLNCNTNIIFNQQPTRNQLFI